jgi:hypothetical protein
MTEPIARIEAALSRLGAEHEPPAGWEARVLAAATAKPRWPRWWIPLPVGALAAMAAGYVFLFASPKVMPLALAVTAIQGNEALRSPLRGDSLLVGTQVSVTASGAAPHRALWIYRDDQLMLTCPGDDRCQSNDKALHLVAELSLVGKYMFVALSADSSIDPPSGAYAADVADAKDAGWMLDETTVNVR